MPPLSPKIGRFPGTPLNGKASFGALFFVLFLAYVKKKMYLRHALICYANKEFSESTFALWCKQQSFSAKKIRLYKHRRYFSAKKIANLKNL